MSEVDLSKLQEVGHATEFGWQERVVEDAIEEISRLRAALRSDSPERGSVKSPTGVCSECGRILYRPASTGGERDEPDTPYDPSNACCRTAYRDGKRDALKGAVPVKYQNDPASTGGERDEHCPRCHNWPDDWEAKLQSAWDNGFATWLNGWNGEGAVPVTLEGRGYGPNWKIVVRYSNALRELLRGPGEENEYHGWLLPRTGASDG